ncbi:MAG: sulfur carrier protein ThiS [Chloroflexota bacterium]|nr:sulfur carrier protein ThiS [Chloroflexota bacterium]
MSSDNAQAEQRIQDWSGGQAGGTPTEDGAGAGRAPAASGEASVTVHPHGELTAYFGRVSRVHVPITPGMTISALLEQLGVPAKEVWVHALNGETVKPDATLADGDTLELFSPVAGG